MSARNLIFVYGTLLSGTGSRMHQWLAAHADFVDQGAFQGRLFRLGDYPGVVASRRATDRVRGEVYRLHHPASALAQLDIYENYDSARPSQSEYLRLLRPVRCQRGGMRDCWIYLYNGSATRFPRIASGDFLTSARLAQRIQSMEVKARSRWASGQADGG